MSGKRIKLSGAEFRKRAEEKNKKNQQIISQTPKKSFFKKVSHTYLLICFVLFLNANLIRSIQSEHSSSSDIGSKTGFTRSQFTRISTRPKCLYNLVRFSLKKSNRRIRYRNEDIMYFILTAKSLLWVTLSVVSTVTLFTAIYSPKWLIGPTGYNCLSAKSLQERDNGTEGYYEVHCRPSVGIYYRCKKINGNQHCGSFAVEGLSTDPLMFPTAWKIALLLMSTGVSISFLMSAMAVCSFCKQAIRKKSVFGLAGSGQGFAGLLYLMGVICFAAGWGSERVVMLCGTQAEPFVSADCTTGSGLYTAAFGVFLTFATAMLSGPADRATSSDKVALQLEQGENIVFLL